MVVTGQLVTVVYVIKLAYFVDSGTGDTVVPAKIGLGVDDVTTDATAEDLIAEVAFWLTMLLGEALSDGPLLFKEGP